MVFMVNYEHRVGFSERKVCNACSIIVITYNDSVATKLSLLSIEIMLAYILYRLSYQLQLFA